MEETEVIHVGAFGPKPRKKYKCPGVIESIIALLYEAGNNNDPQSIEQLVLKLTRKFPKRDPEGMLVTVRAQVSRLPKSGKIHLVKTKVGGVTLYQAHEL